MKIECVRKGEREKETLELEGTTEGRKKKERKRTHFYVKSVLSVSRIMFVYQREVILNGNSVLSLLSLKIALL